MTVFEYGGRLLIVDCGVLFPEDDQPGVDLILPDFDYIRDRLDDIEAIVLTHAPRGPHRRPCRTCCARRPTSRSIGSRLTLALVEAKLREHRIKPLHARGRGGPGRAARARSSLRVRRGQPLDPGRAGGRHPYARRAAGAAHRRLQDGPAPARRPDHRPARVRAGSARRASTCSSSTPPTPRCPASSRTERDIEPVHRRGLRAGRAPDHRRPASPRTSTGSSRSSTRPHKHDRKVAFIGRSMVRNMGVARDLGYLTIPSGLLVDGRRARRRCPTRRSCSSARARRASRWRPCRAWRTTTTRSRSARATPCCSPPR